ncbi:MAG: hypothetical protein ABIZ34_05875 [Candidatus Limnocylindrales bacterium]
MTVFLRKTRRFGLRSRSLAIAVLLIAVVGCGTGAATPPNGAPESVGSVPQLGTFAPSTPPAASQPAPTGPATPTAAPTPAITANPDPNWEGTKIQFDPANFVDPRLDTNPYHPLKPGLQWVRGGTTEVGSRVVPHEIITTMTDVIRVIAGVPTIAMLDESTDSGEVSQVGMDYLALDKDGNVWILGGYTEDYEGGAYTNIDSAWLGDGGGAAVGILSPGIVDANTPRWFIGSAPDEAASIGQPVKVGASECVKFGCFDNVRVVQEGNIGAPDNENKSYAPGVGVINNVPLDASLHQDRFELLNFVELSPAGLAEASQTVLDLEHHARKVAKDVYGSAPKAIRGGA